MASAADRALGPLNLSISTGICLQNFTQRGLVTKKKRKKKVTDLIVHKLWSLDEQHLCITWEPVSNGNSQASS